MADGRQHHMRVWWLGAEGDTRAEWVVIEATGTGHCTFVEAARGASVAEVVEERCSAWTGNDGACNVVGYEYGLAGAWPGSGAVGMTDETAVSWRQRSMLRRASSGGRGTEEGRRERVQLGEGADGGAEGERWGGRLRARGAGTGLYAESLAGGSGPGRGAVAGRQATGNGGGGGHGE